MLKDYWQDKMKKKKKLKEYIAKGSKWFQSQRSKNVLHILSLVFQENVKETSEEIGLVTFKASKGLLDQFRFRLEIVLKILCVELATTMNAISCSRNTSLKQLNSFRNGIMKM